MESKLGLGSRLSGLPRDVLQNEIISRVGELSMHIIRHTLLGHKLMTDLGDDCDSSDVYQCGVKFFKWCRTNFELSELGFNIGRFGTPVITVWVLENNIKECDCLSYGVQSITDCILNGAAYGGNIHMLEYFVNNKIHDVTLDKGLCEIAIDGGQLECLKYLYTLGYESSRVRYTRTRSLEFIEWMRGTGCEWDLKVCYDATLNDNVECLQYAHENGCPWNSSAYEAAAKSGSMACLKYLHKNGCPWNRIAYGTASYGGHLEFLEYLYENRCPIDNQLVFNAADSGKLDCLVWLCEHGYPLDRTISGFNEIWRLVGKDLLRGIPAGSPFIACELIRLSQRISLDCLEYLQTREVNWDHKASMCASVVGRLDVLKWLSVHGYKLNKDLCMEAIKYGQQCMNVVALTDKQKIDRSMYSECLEYLSEQ